MNHGKKLGWQLAWVAVCVAALVAAGSASAGNIGGVWSSLTPVPSVGGGVEGASSGGVGDELIMACGYDSGAGDTATTRIYNIPTDSWSFGADAPGTSSEGASATHGGLVYVIGGRGPGFTANWAYNRVTDMWTSTLTPLPTGRAGLATAVVGNSIYAIAGRIGGGGPNSFGKLTVVERYDINSDTWTTVAPLPAARSDCAAAEVGGKIYVFGGFDAAGVVSGTVFVYDPTKDQWTTLPAANNLPTPRAGFYAIVRNGGTVYCIGGWNGGAFTTGSIVEAFKVASKTWSTGPAKPTPCAEATAVGHGGRIYLLGGSQPAFGASISANEVLKVNP